MVKTSQQKILNPEQTQAVEFGDGPLLIIAGAGTGKTTVITERIKHLITSGRAKASEILALTFTEKAAREMEERVDELMPYGYTQMWIMTFHSFCERVLKQEAAHIGLNPNFRLLPDTDVTMILRKHIFDMGLDYFRPLGNPTKFISGMIQHFSRLRDEDVTPEQYLEWVKNRKKSFDSLTLAQDKFSSDEENLEQKKYEELAHAYKWYEEFKIKEGFLDFANLIGNALRLFRERKNILKQYQEQFKYILVDEFQDTNVAQNELVRLLAGKKYNITVVADDDQSIYKFRGAAVSNVITFRKHFPKTKLIVLSKNYRSTQTILDHSYQLIQHNNPDRLEVKEGINKKLHAMRELRGEEISFLHADRVENEAEAVGKEIRKLALSVKREAESGEKYDWKDIAILVRANNHAEPFMRTFQRLGIPYQFLGPGQLFKQPEVKDLIAYLQVLANFEDNAAVYKVLSMDYFEYCARDLIALAGFARRNFISLFEAAEIAVVKAESDYKLPALDKKTKDKLTSFVEMVHKHLGLLTKETAGQILYYFLEETGMLKNILEYKLPLDEKKAQNITKFFGKLKTYENEHEDASVGTILDWIMLSLELGESPLVTDTDWTDNNAVNILTVHGSKGLEFKVVFLINLVAQRFPTTERREQIPIPDELIKEELPVGDYHEEEERRLFYVGMTRARDLLYLTAANFYGEGKREKKISPFVYEALGETIAVKDITRAASQLSLLDWKKVEPQRNPEASPAEGTPFKTNITYLSYSQIETFRLCPLHYKLRYLLNIPTSPTPALSFGSCMHAALKDIYQQVQQGKKVVENELDEILRQHWIREGYTSKRYEQEMFERGKKYLHEYFTKVFDPKVKPLLLEQPFTIPIKTQKGDLKIGGKIDRIDELANGKIEIIDYKTGRLPSKREVDTNLQLSMYALAAIEIPEPPFHKMPENVVLTLYYFDAQQKISTTRTREQLEMEKEKIIQIAKEIEESDFSCSQNQLCKSCEYKMFCG